MERVQEELTNYKAGDYDITVSVVHSQRLKWGRLSDATVTRVLGPWPTKIMAVCAVKDEEVCDCSRSAGRLLESNFAAIRWWWWNGNKADWVCRQRAG